MPRPKLHLDIETFSPLPIDVGAYRYVEPDDFLILMCGWSLDPGDGSGPSPVLVETDEDDIDALPGLWDDEVIKVAHNAAFERICFSRFLGLPTGRYLDPDPWHDTQAVAAERGRPRGLDKLARALKVSQKDSAGKRLINLFSRPNKRGERNLPEDFPEEWELFKAYCRQDVVTLIAAHRALGGFPTETERAAYLADQRINDRGMPIDLRMAWAAARAAEENRMVQELEVSALTGVVNPSSLPQMGAWARRVGLSMPNWQKETVEAKLEDPELDPTVRQVLEFRQELALSSASKYQTALDSTCADSRLRGGFVFHGAHTGRWAGRGVQLHNLPRAQLAVPDEITDEDERHAYLAARTAEEIELLLAGEVPDSYTIKALIRAMLVGPFSVVDYAAIEARVVAWIAGEEWALDAFRRGRDIYVETAERMGGLSRAEGKIAVLALGYNGGVGSLRALGGGSLGDDSELQVIVDRWRAANPRIVSLWKQMERAFINGGSAGRIEVERRGPHRLVRLPSGRSITYHDLKMENRTKHRVNRETGETESYTARVLTFTDPGRYPARGETYGGRLTENVTQAVARDVLAEALIRLENNGHRVVGHVHDEVIVEGTDVDEVTRLMTVSPDWAEGLPIDAEGFTCDRYRKG